VDLVSILQGEPFVNKLRESFAFRSVETSKCQLDNLPLDRYGWKCRPLEFILQILEIGTLCGCIPEGGLKATNDNLPVDAKMGVAGRAAGMQLEMGMIVERRNTGCTNITVNVEAFG